MQFLKKYLSKTFIGVWRNTLLYEITVKKISFNGKVSILEEKIDLSQQKEFEHFMITQQKENPLTYVGFINLSHKQGILPTDNVKEYYKYQDAPKESKLDDFVFNSFGSNWNIYSERSGIAKFQRLFEKVGYDYLFSPFSLLYLTFKDKFKDKTNLYLVIENEFLLFTIIKSDEVVFGEYIRIFDQNKERINQIRGEIVSRNLDSIVQEDDLDSDVNRGNFDSMNFDKKDDFNKKSLAEIQDDSEDFDDGLAEFEGASYTDFSALNDNDFDDMSSDSDSDFAFKDEEPTSDLSNKGLIEEEEVAPEDINESFVFTKIEKMINQFYSTETDFIENCYIASSIEIKDDLLQLIEDELGLNSELKKINISLAITELIKDEFDSELKKSDKKKKQTKNKKKSKFNLQKQKKL
jgi:hypothetical protein